MNFWKLRAAIADHRLIVAKLEADAARASAVLRAAFVEAGLDPTKNYTVDDAQETFTEQVPTDGA